MAVLVGIIIGIILVDGWIKYRIRHSSVATSGPASSVTIPSSEIVKKNKGKKPLVQITHLENPGAAGGRGSKHPKRLLATSGLMLLAIAGLLTGGDKVPPVLHVDSFWSRLGLAFILGGGISNWIDRARRGTVTDYLKFPRLPIKRIARLVYNISDFCIFLGTIVYALGSLIRSS